MKKTLGFLLAFLFLLGAILPLTVGAAQYRYLVDTAHVLHEDEIDELSDQIRQINREAGCTLGLCTFDASAVVDNTGFFQSLFQELGWPDGTVVIFFNSRTRTCSLYQTGASYLTDVEMAQLTLACNKTAANVSNFKACTAAVEQVGEKIKENVQSGNVGKVVSPEKNKENKRSKVLLLVLLAVSVILGIVGAELWTRKDLAALAKAGKTPTEEWPITMGQFTMDETKRNLDSSQRKSRAVKK